MSVIKIFWINTAVIIGAIPNVDAVAVAMCVAKCRDYARNCCCNYGKKRKNQGRPKSKMPR